MQSAGVLQITRGMAILHCMLILTFASYMLEVKAARSPIVLSKFFALHTLYNLMYEADVSSIMHSSWIHEISARGEGDQLTTAV